MKPPGLSPWDLILRCWPWAAERGLQSPGRTRPPRRWGAFVYIPSVLGGGSLITKNQVVKNIPMANSTMVRLRKTAGFTGWCISSWPSSPFCQLQGNPPLCHWNNALAGYILHFIAINYSVTETKQPINLINLWISIDSQAECLLCLVDSGNNFFIEIK